MFDLFRNGYDYQPPGMRHSFRQGGTLHPFPQTGDPLAPQRFHPIAGGNHPAMPFNPGGFMPMTGGNMQAQPMGGLAGLFRRGMY